MIIIFVILIRYLQFYSNNGSKLIDPIQAKEKIKNNEIQLIIDVRSQFEYDQGHYEGAINIPVSMISKKDFVKYDTNIGIIVYCNTGQRARFAAEKISAFGYNNVYYINGSYSTIL